VSDDDGVFLVPLCGGMRLTMTRGCKGGVFKAEYLLHCSYRCIAASQCFRIQGLGFRVLT